MDRAKPHFLSPATIPYDLVSGVVVFLVALPLCLGVALASNAPLFSGVLAGIVGGLVVGALSKSHTSVSGPAAGLTAIVAAQIATLGSFEAFLVAVVLAGVIQIVLGIIRAGFIAAFFPSSVIKGLLAAIGMILILKQIPHALGHDSDPDGEMAFQQVDHENTFSELLALIGDVHPGAALIGLVSIAFLVAWDQIKPLKKSIVPSPLIVVLLGVAVSEWLGSWSGTWAIGSSHLVQVPVAQDLAGFLGFLQWPDFTQIGNPAIYTAAVTLALVASLETLLNLEAIDKLDPQQRTSPPSRELLAQGIGNVVSGLIGGLPVTSVIVRSSVNINAGGKTRLSTIVHGSLLLSCVMLLPTWLNRIPLASLAAILIVTGFKLASPRLMVRMWRSGRNQFLPFAATVTAIVFTDLLVGVMIGMAVSIAFILHSNLRRPLKCVHEQHLNEDVLRIKLATQVGFLNRAALSQVLDNVPPGGHVLIDARATDYLDADLIDLLCDYRDTMAPARGIKVSLVGFKDRFRLPDEIHFVDHSTHAVQRELTPQRVLKILQHGNERFWSGRRLKRDHNRQIGETAQAQYPIAAVLSCIDSRAPVELIFDLGLGDIFSVRIAGNVVTDEVLGSLEFACAVSGAKLVLVMGHTHCGAVTTALDLFRARQSASDAIGCDHLDSVMTEIQRVIEKPHLAALLDGRYDGREACVDHVSRENVLHTMEVIQRRSRTLSRLAEQGRIAIVGGMYDVATGRVTFIAPEGVEELAGAAEANGHHEESANHAA